MNLKAAIESQLHRLLLQGSLPRSECANAFLSFAAPMIASGVLQWQRAGAGRRLAVTNRQALERFIAQEFPHAPDAFPGETSRVLGVARFRDSKSLRNDLPEIVCVRSWTDHALQCDGTDAGSSNATRRFGVFAFMLGPAETRVTLHGQCALVENPAVFAAFETLMLPVDLVILGRGHCSNRLLDWLAGQSGMTALLHLPDYDPVGLIEHERIRDRLGNKARLHVPVELPERFARYSNPALLANPVAQAALASLRGSALPEVSQIVQWIDRYNAGLEQEALLIRHLESRG